MPYASGRLIHDADSHVMEPGFDWLVPFADELFKERLLRKESRRLAGEARAGEGARGPHRRPQRPLRLWSARRRGTDAGARRTRLRAPAGVSDVGPAPLLHEQRRQRPLRRRAGGQPRHGRLLPRRAADRRRLCAAGRSGARWRRRARRSGWAAAYLGSVDAGRRQVARATPPSIPSGNSWSPRGPVRAVHRRGLAGAATGIHEQRQGPRAGPARRRREPALQGLCGAAALGGDVPGRARL